MDFEVERTDLARAVALATRATARKSKLDVLQNVLIIARDGGTLTVSGTNLESRLDCEIAAAVQDAVALCVPARRLGEWLGTVTGDRVGGSVKDDTLSLRCGPFRCNLKGISADEFPSAPEVGRVAFAAGRDTAFRAALTGVLVEYDHGRLSMVATDGFRLSVATEDLGDAETAATALAPAAVMALAATALKEEAVTLTFAGPYFVLAAGSTRITSQVIDARYHDYRAIIPKEGKTRTAIDVKEMRWASRTGDLFAREGAHRVRLSAEPDRLGLDVSATAAGDYQTVIGATTTGPAVKIAVNARYLLEGLAPLAGERAAIEITNARRPLVVKPETGNGYLHVMMPMELSEKEAA